MAIIQYFIDGNYYIIAPYIGARKRWGDPFPYPPLNKEEN
jgi:hypothetical protein